MSWASKTFKKAKNAFVKLNKNAGWAWALTTGDILGGASIQAGIEPIKKLVDAYEGQKEAAKEAAEEQKRANEEAKAIAAAQGGEQVADNSLESISEAEQNKKRRGYLSTLASQNTNLLLGAAASGKKSRLGD